MDAQRQIGRRAINSYARLFTLLCEALPITKTDKLHTQQAQRLSVGFTRRYYVFLLAMCFAIAARYALANTIAPEYKYIRFSDSKH